ncbi:MAG: SGNH/GDSL hydrolase family protein [Deltaproteobacteria bacterium]|nr:SGNH/GDSL hydrolase family protein [Deltaproteobacteria bacterium]
MKKNYRLRKILFALAAAGAGFLVLGLLMEMVLAAGLFDGRSSPSPVYIPKKFKAMDFAINRDNHLIAKNNPHYFNDIPRNLSKPEKTLRIAVIGDSFIFGDGAPYDTIWSHKLERIISNNYENVEVVSWGRNGWSTQDELNFLAAQGFQYKPDVVVVGCFSNDLASYFHADLRFFWQGGRVENFVKTFFPRSVDFFNSYLKRFYEVSIDSRYDYASALSALYTAENLDRFEKTVKAMKRLSDQNSAALVFVLTPDSPSSENREFLGKLGDIFLKSAVTCLDLFPAVDAKFSETNPRTLWANPANRHPGDLLTQLFADEVFRFLKKNHFLAGAKKGKRHYADGREALSKPPASDTRPLDFIEKTGKSGVSLLLTADLVAASQSRGVSGVHLYENDKALGRVYEAGEAANGAGLFCVSGLNLIFSSSDRSDPLTNGRVYSLSFPEKRFSLFIHIRDKPEALRLVQGRLQYEGRDPALVQKAEALAAEVAASARSN